MSAVPIAGPSYNLEVRKADVQRSINLFPVVTESGTAKAPAILQPIPGLSLFATLGAEVRGGRVVGDRCFVVADSTLYELDSAGTATSRGTLSTSTGFVDMAHGNTQLVMVDGANGYALTLSSNTFQTIGSNFYGSSRVAFLDGYFVFIRPDTGQFYWTAIDDATTLDALDFATAEGSPDDLVSVVADHRELWLFGENTTEVWINTGSEAVFERNSGAFMEHGCAAAFSAQKMDNTVFWLGKDENGSGVVYRAQGYTPVKISTKAIDEQIQRSTDISGARAYTYQQDGHSFYVLNVPGLETTLVYDVASGAWHERAELVDGEYEPHRGTFHVYAFSKHLIGADDGKVYWYDTTKNTNNGDVLVRDRISPHAAAPGLSNIRFNSVELDCTVGGGKADGSEALLMMRYSNDGGNAYTGWRTASLGAIGERTTRARFLRCGMARDRVWHFRVTDDVSFAIVGANLEARAGR